jgi:mono/diheme cytochrome c family protein
MKARRLIHLLVLVGLGAAACDENILDPMADRQRKAMRYKQSSFYDDGLSMRAPPEGTVPRERITLNPRVTTGRELDGPIQPNAEPLPVYVTTIPVPVTRKLLDVGRKRYDITCGTCHGTLGDGDSIVARQMSLRPPPSLHKYVDRPAGYIFEVISKGFGMMASYAAELTVEERWGVVAYVRALQLSQLTAVAELPPEERQKLEALPPGVLDPPLPPKRKNGHGHGQPHGPAHEQPSHEQPSHQEKR